MVWETKVEKHEPPFYRHFLTCLASVQSKTEEEFVSLLINYSSIYLYLGLTSWRCWAWPIGGGANGGDPFIN
jgi:hypothetical protein